MKWLVLIGVLLALACLGWSRHGHWIDRYRSATGSSCCGVEDCAPAQARLVADQGESWLAEVNGWQVSLPKGSVHLSEEPAAYWCDTLSQRSGPPVLDIRAECRRCLFVPVGG